MNYRFFSVIFAVLMSCNVSLFCFLTPKQEGYFLELVEEMDSQKRSTIFSERIKDELHNHTYNFHTLLLIIDRAEEHLEIGAFSTSLYNTLQTVYKNLFYELWDKLSEPLPALTREAIEKKLTYLFDFSCQAIDYIFLKNKKHTSSAYYIVRHDIIRYFLTILGLSEAAHQSPGMLLYSSTEKKEYLRHAHQKLMKTISYICETLEPSMIEFPNGPSMEETEHESHKNSLQQIQADFPKILRNCEKDIEGRFIEFDHEDFIHNTLPALSNSCLKLSGALFGIGGLAWLWVTGERLSKIPFREKIAPAIAEGGISLQTFNRLTRGLNQENIQQWITTKEAQYKNEIKEALEPYNRQLIGNLEEAKKEKVGILRHMNTTMATVNGEDQIDENGAAVRKHGIIEKVAGYDLLENERKKHIPGIIDHVEGITKNVRVMVGTPTKDSNNHINDFGRILGKASARGQRPLSEPTEDDLQPITAELFQRKLEELEDLQQEPPQRAHGQGEEQEIIEPESPQEGRRCLIQ